MKAGERFGIEAKILYTAQGGEIDDIDLIRYHTNFYFAI